VQTETVAPPNTVPWPPLIFGAAVAAALVLQWALPLDVAVPSGTGWAGAGIMAAGAGLDMAAMLAMRRHHANILPHRAATALVIAWPFSISRNPIYLGNVLLLVGAALAFGNPWFLVIVPAAVWAVTVLAIRREEAHLAALFGAAWLHYARRVPRWFRLAS